MKAYYNENNEIVTTFSSEEEKETVFNLIKNHIELMPKTYRKRYVNWVMVADLTHNGSGYSESICKALGVNPQGEKWVVKENDK